MNEQLRVLVVDDESGVRRGIQLLLQKCENVQVVGEAGTGEAAVRQIRKLRPDLVFLDVQMPDIDGFAVLGRIAGAELPMVIFLTAYDQYAVRAFEVQAIDYVLKPFDDSRLFAALDRARQHLRRQRAEVLNSRLLEVVDSMREVGTAPAPVPVAPSEPNDRVVVRNGGEVIVLKSSEIDWIEADGDYVKIHFSGRSLLQRETMASLQSRLDSRHFRRIHRSTIVNLDRVVRLISAFNGEHVVQLKDGTRLKVSKGYRDGLRDWLGSAR